MIHHVTDDHLILTWDRCVGVVWKRETTLEGIEALTATYREQALRFPAGIYLLTIIERSASLPSGAEREALALFLRTGIGRTRMSAVVHEGNGFRAAAVRSVVTGMSMLVRLPYPHEIFASVEQAASWLATTPHDDVDPEYTTVAVTQARRNAESQVFRATGQ